MSGSPGGLLLALTFGTGSSSGGGGDGTPIGLLLALTVTGTAVVPPTPEPERTPPAPDPGGAGSVSGRKKKSVGQRIGPALSSLYEPPKPSRSDELEDAYQHALERAAEAEQVSPELAQDFYGNAEAIKELMAAKPDGAQAKAAMAAELARIQNQIRDDEEALTVVLLLA